MEDAAVVVDEGLVRRHQVLQQGGVESEAGQAGQYPAVAQLALVDVKPNMSHYDQQ